MTVRCFIGCNVVVRMSPEYSHARADQKGATRKESHCSHVRLALDTTGSLTPLLTKEGLGEVVLSGRFNVTPLGPPLPRGEDDKSALFVEHWHTAISFWSTRSYSGTSCLLTGFR